METVVPEGTVVDWKEVTAFNECLEGENWGEDCRLAGWLYTYSPAECHGWCRRTRTARRIGDKVKQTVSSDDGRGWLSSSSGLTRLKEWNAAVTRLQPEVPPCVSQMKNLVFISEFKQGTYLPCQSFAWNCLYL